MSNATGGAVYVMQIAVGIKIGRSRDPHQEEAISAIEQAIVIVERDEGKAMTRRRTFALYGDFVAAVHELRKLDEHLPTKAEAIRRAVMLARDAKRREHKGKR
jgi:hypothetical protein